MTPEQWKKLEEARKIEEEKRLREKGDNWRERGLDQMMGGVLEVKKEDELKKVHFSKICTDFDKPDLCNMSAVPAITVLGFFVLGFDLLNVLAIYLCSSPYS